MAKEPQVLHPAAPLTLVPGSDPGGLGPTNPAALPNPARVYHDAKAPGSRPAIRAVLGRIAGWLEGKDGACSWEETCRVPWWEVRARHVALVRSRLAESSAPATVNRDLSILRSVITVAWENEMMGTDPYTRAVHIRGVDKDRTKAGRALEPEELRRLIAAAREWGKSQDPEEAPRGVRAGAVLALMYGAGLRRAEVVSILVENVDGDASRILLVGKRNKRRVAHVAPGWRALILEWIVGRGTAPGRLFHVRAPETIGRIMEELRERAEVEPFTPHDLRRSFGTHLLNAGKDLSIVRDLLGHDSVQTTVLYDRRGEKEMVKAIEDLERPE